MGIQSCPVCRLPLFTARGRGAWCPACNAQTIPCSHHRMPLLVHREARRCAADADVLRRDAETAVRGRLYGHRLTSGVGSVTPVRPGSHTRGGGGVVP